MSTTETHATTQPRPLTREEVKVGDFLVLPTNGRDTINGFKYSWYVGQVAAVDDIGFTVWPVGISTVGMDEGKATARYREPFGPITWEMLPEKHGRQYIRHVDKVGDAELMKQVYQAVETDIQSLRTQARKADSLLTAFHIFMHGRKF
jgi:hypothetical protein